MRAYHRLRVRLKKADREKLDGVLSGGIQPVRTVLRALALEHLHEGKSASEVAGLVRLTPKAVREIGRRYEGAGLDQALYDKPRPGAVPVLGLQAVSHVTTHHLQHKASPPRATLLYSDFPLGLTHNRVDVASKCCASDTPRPTRLALSAAPAAEIDESHAPV